MHCISIALPVLVAACSAFRNLDKLTHDALARTIESGVIVDKRIASSRKTPNIADGILANATREGEGSGDCWCYFGGSQTWFRQSYHFDLIKGCLECSDDCKRYVAEIAPDFGDPSADFAWDELRIKAACNAYGGSCVEWKMGLNAKLDWYEWERGADACSNSGLQRGPATQEIARLDQLVAKFHNHPFPVAGLGEGARWVVTPKPAQKRDALRNLLGTSGGVSSTQNAWLWHDSAGAVVIKQMSVEELHVLKKIWQALNSYLDSEKSSLLSRLHGVFRIGTRFFIVQSDGLLQESDTLRTQMDSANLKRYQLKGAIDHPAWHYFNRDVAAMESRAEFLRDHPVGVKHKTVTCQPFKDQIMKDTNFLESQQLHKYSLDVAVDSDHTIHGAQIIDILTPWAFKDVIARGISHAFSNSSLASLWAEDLIGDRTGLLRSITI